MKFRTDQSTQRFLCETEKHLQIRAEKLNAICSESQSRYLQQGTEYFFSFRKNNLDQTLLLCCISWYLPEVLRIPLQLDLLDDRKRFGPDYEQRIFLLLESKAKMLIYILESTTWRTPEEFFGKLLANTIKLQCLAKKVPKPKRTQRHRGYRDKGSLRIGVEFLHEEQVDFSLRELQLEIEEIRRATQDSQQFWSGFLE